MRKQNAKRNKQPKSETPHSRKWWYPVKASHDHGLHVVAFDLDGTLAKDTWPSPTIGEPIEDGIKMAKHYWQQGYQIIIYTARPASHREDIEMWLFSNELGFVYDVVCDKPSAWLYVDDRSYNPKEEA